RHTPPARPAWSAHARDCGASREEESYGRGCGERCAQGSQQIAEPGRVGWHGGGCRKGGVGDLVGGDHFYPLRRDSRRGLFTRCILFTRCALRARAGGIGKNEPGSGRGGHRAFVATDLVVERGDNASCFLRAGIRRFLLGDRPSRIRPGWALRGLPPGFFSHLLLCPRLLLLPFRAACLLARLRARRRVGRLLRLRHNRARVAIVIACLRLGHRSPASTPAPAIASAKLRSVSMPHSVAKVDANITRWRDGLTLAQMGNCLRNPETQRRRLRRPPLRRIMARWRRSWTKTCSTVGVGSSSRRWG